MCCGTEERNNDLRQWWRHAGGRQIQRQDKRRKMGYRRGEMMLSLVTIILLPYQSGKWPARGAVGLTDYLNRE